MKIPAHRRLLTTLTAAVLAASTVAAWAHARPVKSNPAPDSAGPAPTQISIEFSEALEPKFSKVTVTTEGGSAISTAASAVDPADHKHMTLALPPLKPALYVVHWTSVADDGHKAEGTYKFTVK